MVQVVSVTVFDFTQLVHTYEVKEQDFTSTYNNIYTLYNHNQKCYKVI